MNELAPIKKEEGLLKKIVRSEMNHLTNVLNPIQKDSKKALAVIVARLMTDPNYNKITLCSKESILNSLLQMCQNYYSNDIIQNCTYLIPYGKELKYQLSYIGLIKIALQLNIIDTFSADVVKEKDDFKFHREDLKEVLTHNYSPFEDRGETKGSYFYYCKGEHQKATVLTLKEIEDIKNCSLMKASTIWTKWYDQMAIKSAVRRAFKFINFENTDFGRIIAEDNLNNPHDFGEVVVKDKEADIQI